MAPVLHLAVQYASTADAPTRARVRRLAASTLAMAARRDDAIAEARLVVRFVDADEGRALNRDFRSRDYATNVLTFPMSEVDGADGPRRVEADIVVCLPVVSREAREQKKRFAEHCAHLIVHGTLHACGYDHEDAADAEAMEDLERDVLARFRIDDPYAIAS